jgi:hypothetical protein
MANHDESYADDVFKQLGGSTGSRVLWNALPSWAKPADKIPNGLSWTRDGNGRERCWIVDRVNGIWASTDADAPKADIEIECRRLFDERLAAAKKEVIRLRKLIDELPPEEGEPTNEEN